MRVIIISIMVLTYQLSDAQNRVDIRLSPTELGLTKSCFDFELRSIENSSFELAGQNYRIYFDPHQLKLIDDELKSYGNKRLYSPLKSHRKHHSDALSIAMINLGVDAIEYDKKLSITLKPQMWTKTSNVCFSHEENADFKLIWARPEETSDLATAYVSLSEWESAHKQSTVIVNEYFDFDNSKESYTQPFHSEINVFPNPVVDMVNISIPSYGHLKRGKMTIVDAAGNMIKRIFIDNNVTEYKVNLRDVPAGNYFLDVWNEGEEIVFHSTFVKSSL